MKYTCLKPQGMVRRWIALSFCVALLLFTAKMNAQTAGTASIQGVVTDASGAVVQNATVTITNTATEVKHTTVTGGGGLYSFPNIAIGTYVLEATAPGFENYRQTNIVLEVGSSIAVNPALRIGGANLTVEVEATGLALQTEDSSLKQTIDQATVTEMPLNGRLMTQLITLTGGAVNANENNDESGSKTFYNSAVISIGGGQGNATDYRLDGADHNDYMTNVNLPFPFPDAVAEFSVETAALGAQSGLHPGGLVNVVTRSGTNQWHGDAFEFIRNNYIDAKNFFSTKPDTLHMDQFGGTFGGRIIRDKVFGFAGYQRYTSKQSLSNSSATVPTVDNLAGDFSHTDSKQLLDPTTKGNVMTGNVYPSAAWATVLNPQAKALVAYLPSATNCSAKNYCISANTGAGGNGFVSYSNPQQITENLFVTRIDSTINSKHSLYGRYLLDGVDNAAFFSPTNLLITQTAGNLERVQGLTIGETYIINSKMVNSVHATVDRRRNNRGPAPQGMDSSTLGINMYDLSNEGMQLAVSGGSASWKTYCGTCSAAHFNVNTLSLTDDIDWTHGKHQVAFGGEWVQTQLNVNNVYEGNGSFAFTGVFSNTGPNQAVTTNAGKDGNLDFLTGSMASIQQSKAQQNALREPIPSLYVQDTYHATTRIVLNAGVRWDPEFVASDYFNRGSVFNMSDFLAGTPKSTVYPNAPAGSLFYGDPGVPKPFTQNSPWQFSPRVGLTFDPDGKGKTVIRAGGAMVYDEPNLFTGQRVQQNPPFAETITNAATKAGGPLSFTNPWVGGTSGSTLGSAGCSTSACWGPFPQPIVPTSAAQFFTGTQYIVLPTKFHSPYTLQWTASVQRQFARGWQAQVDYVGNQTVHGPYGLPMNPANNSAAVCAAQTGGACNPGNQASRYQLTIDNPVAGPYYAGGGTTSGIGSGAGSMFIMAGASATYHGIVASIEHRMSSSFVFMANYTWSHCIDISDNAADVSTITIQNPANIKGDKGSCGFDFRDIFNTSLVASSHFAVTGWKGQVINHWEISPLVHATDGNPFTVTVGKDNSFTSIGNDRPNLSGSAVYTHNKITQPTALGQYTYWINTAAFSTTPGTFGSSGRFAYRGPKFFQADCDLNRSFPLREKFALDLRLEAFNVLNHPNFAAPGSSAGSNGYLGTSTPMSATTNFGTINATMLSGGGARIFQGAMKVTF
ncbi:MAG: carboxypeptidase-like regulatory domain-containing protein [Terracidiphilus sp.]